MRRSVLALAAAALLTPVLAGQVPGTSVVGQVRDAVLGTPIRNARVAAGQMEIGAPVVLTDAEGRFALALPPGALTVTLAKTGFAPRTLRVGDVSAPLDVRLERSAAIAGRVINEYGEPAVGVRISAGTIAQGSNRTTEAMHVLTDDLGEYRLGGLAPGRYVVSIGMVGPMVQRVISRTQIAVGSPAPVIRYYPDAADPASAQAFDLAPGAEASGITFFVAAADIAGTDLNSTLRVAPVLDSGQPMARGRGRVGGRALDASGAAVAGADVMLMRRAVPTEIARTRTAADGAYEFDDVAPESFRLAVSKSGYLPMTGDRASVRTFELTDDARQARVDLWLSRWVAIAGRVLDELGEPIQGAAVQVLRIRYENGRRRLVGTGSANPTDDRGAYRVWALEPGAYLVSASIGSVSSADVPGYTRTYYPGTPNPSLAQFVVATRGDAPGIEFNLARARTARVSGRLLDAGGGPTTGGTVLLRASDRSSSVTSAPVGARILRDGSFEFPNVPEGDWVVQADRGRKSQGTEGEFGAVPVAVNGTDVTDLTVQLTQGSSIHGRIVFEGQGGPPAGARVEITTVPVDYDTTPPSGFATAETTEYGAFELAGLHGLRRLRVRGIPDGWALREILVRGVDAIDEPLAFGTDGQSLAGVEIVLTDRITTLAASVVDGDGRFVPSVPLIVFPADRRFWYDGSRYLRKAAADTQGLASIQGLPFGSYYAAAGARLPDEGPDAWQDPGFLESLIRDASTVTLTEGRSEAVTLRVPGR